MNPFAPLRVEAAPNPLTKYKLDRTQRDAAQCLVALEETGFAFTKLEDRETGPGCGLDNAVRIDRSGVAVSAPFSLSCRASLALAWWETHVLQPEARRILGSEVARLEHFGSYACRNVYGRPDARRSGHATADALDVAGFVLADGRRIRVLRDYEGPEPEARFLRSIRDGACRSFDVVLGPEYNAAHRDHLHLEAGARYRICR